MVSMAAISDNLLPNGLVTWLFLRPRIYHDFLTKSPWPRADSSMLITLLPVYIKLISVIADFCLCTSGWSKLARWLTTLACLYLRPSLSLRILRTFLSLRVCVPSLFNYSTTSCALSTLELVLISRATALFTAKTCYSTASSPALISSTRSAPALNFDATLLTRPTDTLYSAAMSLLSRSSTTDECAISTIS